MMTVHEVSKLTGVSIRTLQYYDKIHLLSPSDYTESGYRLYDDTALERLQQIMLFYNCTPEILSCLGKMYSDGGEFTENIDKVGGVGTADFSARAIDIYCGIQ